MRKILEKKDIIQDKYQYIIDAVKGTGATCVVYCAHYFDNNCNKHNVLLKECYPFSLEITRNSETKDLIWPDEKEKEKAMDKFGKAHDILANSQTEFKIQPYKLLRFLKQITQSIL